jgi:hypothetical protein
MRFSARPFGCSARTRGGIGWNRIQRRFKSLICPKRAGLPHQAGAIWRRGVHPRRFTGFGVDQANGGPMTVLDTAIEATRRSPAAPPGRAVMPQATRQCRTLLQEDAGRLREVFGSVGSGPLAGSEFTFDESFGTDEAGAIRLQSGRVLAMVNPLRVATLARSIGLDAASMLRCVASAAVASKIGVSLCTRGVGLGAGTRRLIAECGAAEVFPAGALLCRLRASIFDRPGTAEPAITSALLCTFGRLVPRSRLLSLLWPRCDAIGSGRKSIAQLASVSRLLPGSSLAAALDCFVAGRGIAAADLPAFRQLLAVDYLAELRSRLAMQGACSAV